MDRERIVKEYFEALDSDLARAEQYLDEGYQLVDFTKEPMDRTAMLELIGRLKKALPNLSHSLYNLRVEGDVVKVTIQRSGTNSGHLDLRKMGVGIVPRSQKFIIFPNVNTEFIVVNDKITVERDVSPVSPNRRFSGMLKAFGVNMLGV